MKFCYPGIIKKREDGAYHVHFPDLEMCEAVGRDLDQAIENAKEAERNWIELELMEEEAMLPPRSELRELSIREGEMVQNISVNIRFMEGYDE